MTNIRVIINGAKGRMGRLATEALSQSENFLIVAKTGRQDDLSKVIAETKPHLVLELTQADCVYKNTKTIIENKVHPVVGASGLTTEQIIELQTLAAQNKLGGIIVPNFSLGAVLMMSCAKKIAEYFTEVEIIEAHHPQKLDSPSGTALQTARDLSSIMSKNVPPGANQAARGYLYNNINIHALRLPGIIAKQDIIFGNAGETLTISHQTTDRISFVQGILLACKKVNQLTNLKVGLESLL